MRAIKRGLANGFVALKEGLGDLLAVVLLDRLLQALVNRVEKDFSLRLACLLGGGLVAGLLAQIGRAIGSETLRSIGRWASWVLPFEALYQDALHSITSGTSGFARFALELGPFGGSEGGGVGVRLWAVAYLLLVGAACLGAFARRDLP